MNAALAELVFMMVVLKLPILYLCGVVWWAVRAEPPPPEGARLPVEPGPACPWRRPRRRPTGSRGGSARTRAVRHARVAA